jgi:two-component system sensor kinase FixL
VERNERCLWVAAPPLAASAAIQALREAWPAVDDAVQAGALHVLDCERWYGTSGALRGHGVLELWIEEEKRALDAGYCGLRIAGNTSFLAARDWPLFLEYESAASEAFRGRRIVALCSYSQVRCNARQLRLAMAAHHCAFEGPDATGSMIAVAPDSRAVAERLRSWPPKRRRGT